MGMRMPLALCAARKGPRLVSLLAVIVATFVVGAQPARAGATALANGDFGTGDFAGWTLFTTPNGVLDAAVVPFDVNALGTTSYSAAFSVGQATFEGFDVQRGGGIFQDVQLFNGNLFVSADVASDFPYPFCNDDGGTMQLLVDGVVVDTHSFGEMCGPITAHARLSGTVPISSAGTHEIRFLVTRAGLLSGVQNYVDNIVLSGTATENEARRLADLGDAVRGVGPGTSLSDKVEEAQIALGNGDVASTCSILRTVTKQVQAQSGKSIAPNTAGSLAAQAAAVRAMLGC
jgi:hypothetical protein